MPPASLLQPRIATRSYESVRWRLPGGAGTTLHLGWFERASVQVRVARIGEPATLMTWCRAQGVGDAVVGGFFVRPHGRPLGELRVDGRPQSAVAFDYPWSALRSCVHVSGRNLRLAPRHEIEPEPAGDLLQAGPLMVRGGISAIREGHDPEGFSAGADQFDSDITDGRYPRAAVALCGPRLLALVCDGRSNGESGMTLGELADTLVELGAETAINLDGGGSASLVYGGRLRNRPHEEHGIEILGGRPIATALVFQAR